MWTPCDIWDDDEDDEEKNNNANKRNKGEVRKLYHIYIEMGTSVTSQG